MIQKRACSLSTKVNRYFYDMVKIRVIIMCMLIFLEYMKLYSIKNKKILLITYQNKTKMPKKNRKYLVSL